jgi:hypothetical protein
MLEVLILVLLGTLVWQVGQLNKQTHAVFTELVTARWEWNQRVRVLERKVEGEG